MFLRVIFSLANFLGSRTTTRTLGNILKTTTNVNNITRTNLDLARIRMSIAWVTTSRIFVGSRIIVDYPTIGGFIYFSSRSSSRIFEVNIRKRFTVIFFIHNFSLNKKREFHCWNSLPRRINITWNRRTFEYQVLESIHCRWYMEHRLACWISIGMVACIVGRIQPVPYQALVDYH